VLIYNQIFLQLIIVIDFFWGATIYCYCFFFDDLFKLC